MMLLKGETEYEEALVDAKRIKEIDPNFSQINKTIIELESMSSLRTV